MNDIKDDPLVIIVILTLNQKDVTLACLDELKHCDYPNYKTILIDNGSSDGTAEAIKEQFSDITLIVNDKNYGVAGGRNIGINYANNNFKYEHLLILDNDTLPDKNMVKFLVKRAEEKPELGIVFPKIYYQNSPNTLQYAGNLKINLYTGIFNYQAHKKDDRGQFDEDCYSMLCPGACMMIRKKVIDEVGLFDERFNPYGYEDVDYALSIGKKGYKILYVHDAILQHKESLTASDGKYNVQYTKLKGSRMRLFLSKHTNIKHKIVFYLTAPISLLRTLFRELRKGNAQAVVSLVKSYFSSSK